MTGPGAQIDYMRAISWVWTALDGIPTPATEIDRVAWATRRVILGVVI